MLKKSTLINAAILVVSVLWMSGCNTAESAGFTIQPSKCSIVIPDKSDDIKTFAAEELQKHLKLITSVKIPVIIKSKIPAGNFPIYIGIPESNNNAKLEREETRYKILPEAIYIYGEDNIYRKLKTPVATVTALKANRTGTLFAVYAFLENEFGVRWIKPGDSGICYTEQTEFKFKNNDYVWTTKLRQRQLRSLLWKWKIVKNFQEAMPENLHISMKEAQEKALTELIWMKRMRMGSNITLNYGHAFTRWWDKYGKTNPEYFALTAKGKREPLHKTHPDRVKMCVSNKELHKKIVEEWYERYKINPARSDTINVCENDSRGYCQCDNCMKLDVREKGTTLTGTGKDQLSDRYIYFANEVLKEARKKVPDVKVVMYAYSNYKNPPKRERVSDGVILGFVPGLITEDKDLEKKYSDWRKAGCKEMFLRPNDMHYNTGLPLGFERKMFDNFKIGIKYGIIGTDYDTLHGFWDISGFGDYILARAHIYPDKTYEYWEDEYCSVFGPGKKSIKEFFAYWRKNLFKKVIQDREKLGKIGRFGNFRRGLMWSVPDYYSHNDFDKTDAMLKNALTADTTKQQEERIKTLLLANQHSRLTFAAIKANNRMSGSKDPVVRINTSKALLDFRKQHKDDLNINWPMLFDIEKKFGDITGTMFVATFKDNINPVKPLPLYWYFKIDPNTEGVKKGWGNTKWREIKKWKKLRTDRQWEAQVKVDKDLAEKLKTYDGEGWYATSVKIDPKYRGKKVFLTFGAVDETCWVYVNGVKTGERIFNKPDDWKTPFTIRIDQGFTKSPSQTIIVQVQDKAGLGGIWKQVWLSVEK